MQTLCRRIAVIFVLCAVTLFAYADLKITTQNTMNNQTTQGTTYIKGARQRSERQFGPMHQVTITQCDRRRTITVSDACRTYMVTPMDEGESGYTPPPTTRSNDTGTTRRGGTITINTSSTNTGETRQMFGYTARHIKSTMTMTSSADACNPTDMTMETDGWYADFSASGMTCSASPRPGNMGRMRPDCQDRIRITGSGMRSHGYPMKQTMTSTTQGHTFTMTEETTELSRATLDPALFEVPADYQQVDTYQGLMCQEGMSGTGAPPRRSNQDELQRHRRGGRGGALCVAPLTNKTSAAVDGEGWRDTLIDDLGRVNVDAVKLDSTNMFDLRAEAADKGCGHVLYTDVMELRAPATRRVGNYRSSLHVVLMPTDDFTPWLDTTVNGTGNSFDTAGEPALRSEAEQTATALSNPR